MATDLALPAFLSSAHGAAAGVKALLPEGFTGEYKELDEATEAWTDTLLNNAVQPVNKTVQALWDVPLQEKKYADLLNSQVAPAEKARLLAVASERSSDWLNAIPVPALGLKLDNESLRIAIGLRLGTAICQPHKCVNCGNMVDSTGRHGLSCKKPKGTIPRHQHVNDIILRALSSAQIAASKEPVGLSKNDQIRPDGLTLFPWSQGKCLVWDYTCRDTLAPCHVMKTSVEVATAAIDAEKEKRNTYAELSTSYTVVPVANETLGSWGPSGLKFITEIGQRIAEHTGDTRSKSYLFQSISMATQRGTIAH